MSTKYYHSCRILPASTQSPPDRKGRLELEVHDCAAGTFERDGYRCTVPACTARRNLQSHHIRFRSACGPDVAWNRTTLCAHHHQRGVHAGRLAIRGRAPDRLIYELGVGRFRSGDVVD